jgi:alpha-ketoglutaric semialdehyde dehydrogenase
MTKYQYGNLVNGQWLDGSSTLQTFNPARPAELVGRYALADEATVDAAVMAARLAQKDWAKLPPARRCELFGKFIDAIESKRIELATAITAEQGKSMSESLGEVAKACSEGRFMIQHVMAGEGARNVPALRPGVRNLVMRRPRGVVVAISPWNFPILTPMRKIAPAVAFGNAIILKASEFTPAAACILGDLAKEHFPAGLVQVLHGGADVGNSLVSHKHVQAVTFTGSVPTGRRIVAATALNLAEVSLELGGKNAAVIHDTEDMNKCLDQVIQAALMCNGQRCTSISRVLVRRELHTAVAKGLVQRAQSMRIGDGFSEGTQLGPMTHLAQLEHVKKMVELAKNEGANVLTGGSSVKVDGCDAGLFYAPTVLDNVQPQTSAAREEIFGPVISLIVYDTLDDAVRILNDVEFGLTASFFSNDSRAIARFIDECETGMIHVNHGTVPDSHMPFGGIKASGVGAYSVGPSASAFYTTEHSVYLGV